MATTILTKSNRCSKFTHVNKDNEGDADNPDDSEDVNKLADAIDFPGSNLVSRDFALPDDEGMLTNSRRSVHRTESNFSSPHGVKLFCTVCCS